MDENLKPRKYGRDEVDYDKWYNDWAKLLAKSHTLEELRRMMPVSRSEADKYARQHSRAISKSHSMSGNSTARARANNLVSAAGDKLIAVKGAIEIYDLFPEHTKEADKCAMGFDAWSVRDDVQYDIGSVDYLVWSAAKAGWNAGWQAGQNQTTNGGQ